MIRDIDEKLLLWHRTTKRALLIDGARQIGKTYSIRKFIKNNYENYIEINFIRDADALKLVNMATSSEEILLYLSTLYGDKLVPGKTIIFFDEIQKCDDIITPIKFLIEDGRFRFILSGSLLGVELKNIKSIPVGYMDIIHMYPMSFKEFLIVNGINNDVIDYLYKSFKNITPIYESLHEKLLKLLHLYLIVGGMPYVVKKYLETNNLKTVVTEQKSIIEMYKQDFAQYAPEKKLLLNETYDLIPSELNSQNKRFKYADIKKGARFDNIEASFIWLVNAGVAIPTYCVQEPKIPLSLSKDRNLLKLFLSDVGLLASMYANNIQLKLLEQEIDINYGGIYENFVAQELKANGIESYYFKNNKIGELDFVIELNGDCSVIEVKSGKSYQKHSALNNVLKINDYQISPAIVLSNYNIKKENDIVYYPIYMTMFLKNNEQENTIYKIDIDEINKMI